ARHAVRPTSTAHPEAQSHLDEIKRLYAAGEWDEVVRLTSPETRPEPGSGLSSEPGGAPDLDYYRGMALAKLKRWPEAEAAFERGGKTAPHDKRFPTELAGIAFLEKRYGAAKRDLQQVLRIDPGDEYANNFLATLFALDDNLPAALKYWNRIGKPQIHGIHVAPPPDLDPLLLRRAFAFSPGNELGVRNFRTTQALLDSLGIFSHPRINLEPLPSGEFNANFSPDLRVGLGGTKLEDALSLLRGAPYETIYPEWFNIHHKALNFSSLLRWDPDKERVDASLSAPFGDNPRWRYRLHLDDRRENWDLSHTFFAAADPVNDMQLEKIEGGGEIQSIVSGRLRWTMGLDASGRTFRNVRWNNPSAAGFFRNGFALEYRAGIAARLFAVPEKRLSLDADASAQLGKLFAHDSSPFAQGEAGLMAHWFPRAQGDDYQMTSRVRAGNTWGMAPFDDLFILGLERDNNLWLRAHIGTSDGKKGSAPLGRRYELVNWDDFKSVYHNGFISLKIGPFLDAGKISDPTRDFGSRRWLLDTGLELKVEALGGATVELFFGKDLRTGHSTFYGTTAEY
ncbi:MAG: tetratricopeptide repeat protein, partial [Terriglobia bacterium]